MTGTDKTDWVSSVTAVGSDGVDLFARQFSFLSVAGCDIVVEGSWLHLIQGDPEPLHQNSFGEIILAAGHGAKASQIAK